MKVQLASIISLASAVAGQYDITIPDPVCAKFERFTVRGIGRFVDTDNDFSSSLGDMSISGDGSDRIRGVFSATYPNQSVFREISLDMNAICVFKDNNPEEVAPVCFYEARMSFCRRTNFSNCFDPRRGGFTAHGSGDQNLKITGGTGGLFGAWGQILTPITGINTNPIGGGDISFDFDVDIEICYYRREIGFWPPPTPSPTPAPTPEPPSCVAGEVQVPVSATSKATTKVMDLNVGDTVKGLDADLNPTTCTVEAVGNFGLGPVYGGYTSNHYLYNSETMTVEQNGETGTFETDEKYEVIADCPLIEDEDGNKFTPIDTDYCGKDLKGISWSDYLLLHKGMLNVVRASGGYWFSGSSYNGLWAEVQEYAPVVCSTMLECMKTKSLAKCEEFDKAASKFIANAITDETKKLAESSFPNIEGSCEEGSASAAVTAGADSCAPCKEVGEQRCIAFSPSMYEVCDTDLIVAVKNTERGTKCCPHPDDPTKIIMQWESMECPSPLLEDPLKK